MTKAHAPRARRAPVRDEPLEESGEAAAQAAPAWPVRARQWLQTRVRAASARTQHVLLAATSTALDKGIASLQDWRRRAGAASEQDAADGRRRPERHAPGRRPRDEPAAPVPIAPVPKRRLRRLLVYLSVMLAGGMIGTALAYDLLSQLLGRRALEIERKDAKLAGYSKSQASLKKALEQQEALRTAAEARVAALAEQAEKARSEPPPPAQTRPANDAGAQALDARVPPTAGRAASGDCTLGGGDVRSALAGCIADMKRK